MTKLSPSQLSTAALCQRKRWLQSVARLKAPKKGYQSFGTVLHGVLERYLLADALGRGADGQPVDLYPPGWNLVVAVARGGGFVEELLGDQVTDADLRDVQEILVLPEDEELLVRTLVQSAIDGGVIERKPGGKVEEGFEMPLFDGHLMVGYIDYGDAITVEDHKTSKSKKYLLSKKSLVGDLQLMIYAKWKLKQLRERGERDPEYIELSHNQFIKGCADYKVPEEPGVRKTTAKVTPALVDQFWDTQVLPLCRQILLYQNTVDPFEIPDPEAGACAAYGGCQFSTICTKQETIPHFKKRVDNIRQNAKEKNLDLHKELIMGLQELLAARTAAKAAGVPPAAPITAPAAAAPPAAKAAVAPPVTKPAVAATPPPAAKAAEPVSGRVIPPWAQALENGEPKNCAACQGTGFNSKGAPCQICVLSARKAGRQTPDLFNITTSAAGTRAWSLKSGGPAVTQQVVTPPVAETKTTTKVADAAPPVAQEEPAVEEPVAADEPAVPEEPAEETPPPEEKRKAGRPKKDAAPEPEPQKGMTLLIGCFPVKLLNTGVVSAEEILRGVDLTDAKGVKTNYFSLPDVFKRRDAIQTIAGKLAEALAGRVVVQSIGNADVDNLMSALLPFASTVIRGAI